MIVVPCLGKELNNSMSQFLLNSMITFLIHWLRLIFSRRESDYYCFDDPTGHFLNRKFVTAIDDSSVQDVEVSVPLEGFHRYIPEVKMALYPGLQAGIFEDGSPEQSYLTVYDK